MMEKMHDLIDALQHADVDPYIWCFDDGTWQITIRGEESKTDAVIESWLAALVLKRQEALGADHSYGGSPDFREMQQQADLARKEPSSDVSDYVASIGD